MPDSPLDQSKPDLPRAEPVQSIATRSKDKLERQKLALEIRELQRRWWQRPAYLSILIPIVLACLTVLAGILSGYFDRERAELKRDVEALKREKKALLESQEVIRRLTSDAGHRLAELFRKYGTLSPRDQKGPEDIVEEMLSNRESPEIRRYLNYVLSQGRGTPTPTATPHPSN